VREYSVAKDKVVREVTAAAQFTRRGEGVYCATCQTVVGYIVYVARVNEGKRAVNALKRFFLSRNVIKQRRPQRRAKFLSEDDNFQSERY
jgi:hypothetical protein